jgi:hypothetical protein
MTTPRTRRPGHERSLSVDAPVLDAPIRAVVGASARAPPRTTLSTEAQSGADKGCDPKAMAKRSSLVGHQG